MINPWTKLDLKVYERHMGSKHVGQMELLNKIMKSQLFDYSISTLTILGIAGGNGLDLISPDLFDKIYAIDINQTYLDKVKERYSNLNNLELQNKDLNDLDITLEESDLVIANLILEYIDIPNFIIQANKTNAKYISVVIQDIDENSILHTEEELEEISKYTKKIDKRKLIEEFKKINYKCQLVKEYELPDNQLFIRLDFNKQ